MVWYSLKKIVKFEPQSEAERKAVIRAAVRRHIATGEPLDQMVRIQTRWSRWAYLSVGLSALTGCSLEYAFHLTRWRALCVALGVSLIVAMLAARLLPLFRKRIDLKR
jgi:hypothetical protein